jgi:predicted ATPase
MILGLLVRHYKIYKGLNFIPISDNLQNNFSIYVGSNGVGKSSILEALNTFFNNGVWNKHKDGKQDETFVAPVFLIKKEIFNKKISPLEQEIFTDITNFFLEAKKNNNTVDIEKFFILRDSLSKLINMDDYYFFVLGNTFKERTKVHFGSVWDSALKADLTSKFTTYNLDTLLFKLKEYYSFVYIPVESKVSDTLRLETFEMQKLMNKDILNTIENVLKEKEFKNPSGNGKINAVDYLNQSLNTFMDEINDKVQAIDHTYSFKVDIGYKKNLTSYDLREKILQAYFSIRTLKKETKEIFELSSGEQRIALIDIATAFLNASGEKDGNLILAIDEPEASMHISKSFKQFKRLEDITKQNNIQVMITTHWYGSLPTIQKGNLHHIDEGDKPSITTFDFLNYLENRRNFPDDIEMKSYFELVSTIISSIKNEQINWLICEGSDDKKYLTHYLNTDIENLQVMPVGGCGNVIKLYQYLYAPFSEKNEKALLKNGKILCLIDSDTEQKTTKFSSNVGNILKIGRLQIDANNAATICNLTNVGNYSVTLIEDCLNPKILYDALAKTIEQVSANDIQEIFSEFEFNDAVQTSRVKGEISILKPKNIEALEKKSTLYEEFEKNHFKYTLADNYISIEKEKTEHRPDIFNKIKDFFIE